MIISGLADVALEDVHDPLAVSKDLAEIRDAARRGGHLARQLLQFSRKDSGVVERIDVNDVVRHMPVLLGTFVSHDIAIDFNVPKTPAFVDIAAATLEQIVLNLAVNSRDAMPHGGTLHVETSVEDIPRRNDLRPSVPAGRYVRICVRDTGCGMDVDTLRQAFDPYFTTKSAGHGTGLGLATVLEIVQGAGGAVGVETVVGQGTSVIVYLPEAPT